MAIAAVALALPHALSAQTPEATQPATQPATGESPPTPAPEAPAPNASAPTPTPAPETAPEAAPEAAPAPAARVMTRRETVDAMSMADLQEAITQIRENSIRSPHLDDLELSRSMFEGLLVRLGTGADLVPSDAHASADAASEPFHAEVLDGRIGYVRLGTLGDGTLASLDAALANFVASGIGSMILDLRTTTGGSLDLAVEVVKRFVPNGSLIFTVRRPGEKQERIFTNGQEPAFRGLLMVTADHGTSGPGETIAEALRQGARAMVIGKPTAGRAVEYSDRKLKGGQVLRIAVAEVMVPGVASIFPDGVQPDIEVELPEKDRGQILKAAGERGVSQFVFDKERPRLNEAALLAGETPDLDSYQEMQRNGGSREKPLRDPVLQRAVDLITTISIYERKSASGE